METRKVQVTGGSTYTVSIPKEWARQNDVETGSVVEFYVEGESLLLTPRSADEHLEGELDVTGLSGEGLKRAVLAMYVAGFDVIRLQATRISPDQQRVIRETIKGLVGVELLEESRERVVIRDLLDSSELSIENAVTRMRLIATSMLEDAVTAVVENDDELGATVVERDDGVDRLWFAVARIFRLTLRSPIASEDLGMRREACFDLYTSARQLERIADHATKIGEIAQDLDDVDDEVAAALDELHRDVADVIDGAMDALFTDDGDEAKHLANAARSDVEALDSTVREVDSMVRDLDTQQARSMGLVVDSLSRSADYGGNVAESALQKSSPTPQSSSEPQRSVEGDAS